LRKDDYRGAIMVVGFRACSCGATSRYCRSFGLLWLALCLLGLSRFICLAADSNPVREMPICKVKMFSSGMTNYCVTMSSNRLESAKCFRPNGELASQVVIGNGVWAEHHENGTNMTLCTYVDGVRHGRMTVQRLKGTGKQRQGNRHNECP
jgi:hypothetical protein